MSGSPLDPNEWEQVLGKLIRYHFNIGEELKILISKIRNEMKSEMVSRTRLLSIYSYKELRNRVLNGCQGIQ